MIANIIIIHYTYGWTQRFVRSFLKNMDEDLIVFDNNPVWQHVKKTRGNRGEDSCWSEMCVEESKYVKSFDRIKVVDVPKPKESTIYELPTHGEVVDFVFNWCLENKYDLVMHLEPDCLVKGRSWHDKMKNKIESNWVVGKGHMNKDGPVVASFCPTLWRIKETLDLGISFNKQKEPYYNTSQRLLHECALREKLDCVNANDFIHYGNGTKKAYAIV